MTPGPPIDTGGNGLPIFAGGATGLPIAIPPPGPPIDIGGNGLPILEGGSGTGAPIAAGG